MIPKFRCPSVRLGRVCLLALMSVWVVQGALAAASAPPAAGSGEMDCPARGSTPQALFDRGVCAARNGRHAQAVELFKAVLVQVDAPRTRLELARSLAALGEAADARVQYQAVLDSDPPVEIQRWVHDEMARLPPPNAADQEKKHPWSFGYSVGYDTNANAGPTNANVDIFGLPFELASESLAQSTAFVAGNLAASWDKPHSNTVSSNLAINVEAVHYRSANALDSRHISLGAGAVVRDDTGFWDGRVAVLWERQQNGHGRDVAALSLLRLTEWDRRNAVSMQAALGHTRQLELDGAVGPFASGSVLWHWKNDTNLETAAGVQLRHEHDEALDRRHTARSLTATAAAPAAWACGKCHWRVEGTIGRTNYAGDDAFFDTRRRDRNYMASAGLSGSTQSNEWYLELEYSRVDSTIELYEFKRTRLIFGQSF